MRLKVTNVNSKVYSANNGVKRAKPNLAPETGFLRFFQLSDTVHFMGFKMIKMQFLFEPLGPFFAPGIFSRFDQPLFFFIADLQTLDPFPS